jgi:indolepyruvate decarboxylase
MNLSMLSRAVKAPLLKSLKIVPIAMTQSRLSTKALTQLPPPHLYPRWERFLKPNDIVVAETGTVSISLGFTRMPAGAIFYNQTLWGSIGWATPAAFGAAIAAPDRRVVLFTGEGAHQFTAQEIAHFAQFARYDTKPVVFVLNNARLPHRAASL